MSRCRFVSGDAICTRFPPLEVSELGAGVAREIAFNMGNLYLPVGVDIEHARSLGCD